MRNRRGEEVQLKIFYMATLIAAIVANILHADVVEEKEGNIQYGKDSAAAAIDVIDYAGANYDCNPAAWFSAKNDFSRFLADLEEGVDYLSLADYVTSGSADGSTNNTQGFKDALAAMESRGIDKLFVPAGHYLIDSIALEMENVSFYGSSVGISLLASMGAESEIGNGLNTALPGHHVSPYGLYFYNVKLVSAGSASCNNGAANYVNNVFISTATGRTIREQYSCGSRIEGNIFLGTEASGQQTILIKISSISVEDNVFGLDMEATDWLETEWARSSEWTCLPEKLNALYAGLELPQMMDTFHCLINFGGYEEGYPIIFSHNIVNASSTSSAEDTDHILYFKGVQDVQVIANYFRGFYDDYMKFSGARDCVVAYNNFDGPECRAYIEECEDLGPGRKGNYLERILYYGNRLGADPDGSNHGRLFAWNYCLETDGIEEEDIQYSQNRQAIETVPSEGVFLKRRGAYGPAHRIFSDNILEDGSGPILIGGEASHLPAVESFDASKVIDLAGELVPVPKLPPH